MNSVTDLLATRVRRVLLEEWDPIGIKDMPEAQDEYDSYVLKICGMLRAGCSTADLCKHLRWIVAERMGLDGAELPTSEIAKKLVDFGESGDV